MKHLKQFCSTVLALFLILSLGGCSGGNGGNSTGGGGSSAADPSKPLHFELSTGVIDYDSYEYVSKGFYYKEGDPTKTICINFSYTNKENKSKTYLNDFVVKAYQNGTELVRPTGYLKDNEPETMKKDRDSVLQDGVLKFGLGFVLQDYSPVTIIAKHNGGKEESNPMVLTIEEYKDNSFDLDRLYGYWEGNGDENLTITTSRITLKRGRSSTYRDNPKLWTDADTLYTDLTDMKELKIDSSGSPLKLTNGQYTFTQKENWSEKNPGSGEPEAKKLGDTISTDFTEITFKKYGVEKELKYSNKSGGIKISTILGQESAGTKYAYIDGTVKNISSNAYSPDNMKAKAVINGTYTLEAKVWVVDAGSTIHDLNPLKSATIVVDVAMDSDIADGIKTIDWYIGFDPSFSGGSKGDPEGSRYYYKINAK